MSDHKGLIGKLVALSATDASIVDGWRRVGHALDRDPLTAILREIDETQLPRALSFRNDNGDILQVEAGNRRLLRIVSASGPDQSALDGVLQKDIAKLTDDETDAIGRALRALQPGDQTVWVRHDLLATSGESSYNGLPVSRLAQALSIDLDAYSDKNLQSAFERFVEDQKSRSEAWVRFENGEEVEHSEPAPAVQWRDSWNSADLTHAQNGSVGIENAPSLCMYGSGGERDPHHIVATCGPTAVVLIVGSADLADIARQWRDLGL